MNDMEEIVNGDVIKFRVDSGLIDRLGRELVGKSETAVSELVKNGYDADATLVEVEFINTNSIGGTIKITDNGLGMNRMELEKGFMTISSSDKIHNPNSLRYNRRKAGRKGIGRFATQRLGTELIIITQKKESERALKLVIDWNKYVIDTNLVEIENQIITTDKIQEEGTQLIINNLREAWSDSEIMRVYRYVSELLQPDFLSERSRNQNIATSEESFKPIFKAQIDGTVRIIADPDKMIFDKSIATIEGWIDSEHNGFCTVESDSLELIDAALIPIPQKKLIGEVENIVKNKIVKAPIYENRFLNLQNVRFKVYYFIYNRESYYANISKLELNNIKQIASEQSGIKLYRNGFRVLPYGEKSNDWLKIDRRYYDESGDTNVPFGNHNFFGFVEIVNTNSSLNLFEETASREGLLENEAYVELVDFVHKALDGARKKIRYGIRKKREEQLSGNRENVLAENSISPITKLDNLQTEINNLISKSSDATQKQVFNNNVTRYITELKLDFRKLLDELGMTRVLAGLGLTIGEFTHEVVQFSPSMNGDLSVLSQQNLNSNGVESLENLTRTIKLFTSYTSYFNATISANVSRELKPQKIDEIVTKFNKSIEADLSKLDIIFETEFYGFDLLTIPMHSSEWSSILYNLYTNAKKAIKRAEVKGQIKIIVGKEKEILYVEFLDNGDGIPEKNREKIFDAFFTTSSPLGFESTDDERLTGTGLGLKIVKDIILTHGGNIELVKPEPDYNTCFRIEVPLLPINKIKEYGL